MFIWRKKKSTKSRTSALFGRWGYKHWDFLCRKHISRGSEICLWLIWASMQNSRLATWRWTRYCSFAKQAGWKKKDFHEVYFLFVKAQLRPKWETETENGFIISFYLSFIRFSDHDPSVRPLRAQQLFPEPGGLFLLTADNMLLTDCPLCSGLLLYILLLQSA